MEKSFKEAHRAILMKVIDDAKKVMVVTSEEKLKLIDRVTSQMQAYKDIMNNFKLYTNECKVDLAQLLKYEMGLLM